MGKQRVSDGDLLQLSIDGDNSAFAELMHRYTPALTRYAWAMMTSRSDVQDIVQEVWMTTWRRLSTARITDSSLLPWLLVTCRNHSLNSRRRNQRNAAVPLPNEMSVDERGAAAMQQLRWVLDEISQLEEPDRQLCQLCLIEGMPYNEAARLVGSSTQAARKRIERVRIKLRKAMAEGD